MPGSAPGARARACARAAALPRGPGFERLVIGCLNVYTRGAHIELNMLQVLGFLHEFAVSVPPPAGRQASAP